jgi:hypothetical protein
VTGRVCEKNRPKCSPTPVRFVKISTLYIILTESSNTFWATSRLSESLPEVNNLQIGENSAHLVTLAWLGDAIVAARGQIVNKREMKKS